MSRAPHVLKMSRAPTLRSRGLPTRQGAGAVGDFAAARRGFERALASGYTSAGVDLAMLLSQPSAHMLDVPRAISLYHQAWEHGITLAAYRIGGASTRCPRLRGTRVATQRPVPTWATLVANEPTTLSSGSGQTSTAKPQAGKTNPKERDRRGFRHSRSGSGSGSYLRRRRVERYLLKRKSRRAIRGCTVVRHNGVERPTRSRVKEHVERVVGCDTTIAQRQVGPGHRERVSLLRIRQVLDRDFHQVEIVHRSPQEPEGRIRVRTRAEVIGDIGRSGSRSEIVAGELSR